MSLVASSGPPNDRDLKLKLHYTVFRSKNYYHGKDTSSTETLLLSLPTELHHQILSYLYLPQLFYARGICRFYLGACLQQIYQRYVKDSFSHFPFHTVGCTTSMIMEPLNGFRFPEAYYRAPDQVQPRFAPLKLVSNEGDAILRVFPSLTHFRWEIAESNLLFGM